MPAVTKILLIVLTAALTAACAPLDERNVEPDYLAYTGEPIDEFRFVNFLEWRPLADKSVLLRFDRNKYYVLKLREPCVAHTREADRLSLDLIIGNRMRVNDRVILDRTRCIIDEIRPLDHEAWTAAGAAGGSARMTGQVSGGT